MCPCLLGATLHEFANHTSHMTVYTGYRYRLQKPSMLLLVNLERLIACLGYDLMAHMSDVGFLFSFLYTFFSFSLFRLHFPFPSRLLMVLTPGGRPLLLSQFMYASISISICVFYINIGCLYLCSALSTYIYLGLFSIDSLNKTSGSLTFIQRSGPRLFR